MSQALATKEKAPLAKAGSSSRLAGADAEDFVLPRVHLYQGLPAEAKTYGKNFQPGDLINTLTSEKITAKSFVPVRGSKQWIKWSEPRGSGMEYSHSKKSDVPEEDLGWIGDAPPSAQEYHNWVVVFDGDEMPVILSFTKTSMTAGKTLNTLEAMRSRKGKGPGLYAIEMKEKSNDKGTWVSPVIRPAGEPSPELVAQAEDWFSTLDGQEISAEASPVADGEFDPDAE